MRYEQLMGWLTKHIVLWPQSHKQCRRTHLPVGLCWHIGAHRETRIKRIDGRPISGGILHISHEAFLTYKHKQQNPVSEDITLADVECLIAFYTGLGQYDKNVETLHALQLLHEYMTGEG